MAQKALNLADVGAAQEEVGGVEVAQHVAGGLHPGVGPVLPHQTEPPAAPGAGRGAWPGGREGARSRRLWPPEAPITGGGSEESGGGRTEPACREDPVVTDGGRLEWAASGQARRLTGV